MKTPLVTRQEKFDFLADPPYDIRYKSKLYHSSREFTRKDVADLKKLKRVVLAPGEDGQLFCSWMQFGQ